MIENSFRKYSEGEFYLKCYGETWFPRNIPGEKFLFQRHVLRCRLSYYSDIDSSHNWGRRVFWAVLLIACVVAIFKYPSVRKTVFVIIGVLALLIAGYFLYDRSQTEASKHRVRIDELQFTDVRLGPESYGSAYRLTGRVKNNSRYTVVSIKAKIQISDCDEKSNCDVIGEEEESISPVIPSGQVRDIDDSVYFSSSTRVRGHFQWNYRISEIQARP